MRGGRPHVVCQTRVWSKSRVTKRFTGREEVGKMTHESKTHKASLILIRGPVTSPCLHCPAGCLVAPVHKCCCTPIVLARSHVFFVHVQANILLQPGSTVPSKKDRALPWWLNTAVNVTNLKNRYREEPRICDVFEIITPLYTPREAGNS